MRDNNIFNFLKGFAVKENKHDITFKYISGQISKEEYLRRMKGLSNEKKETELH